MLLGRASVPHSRLHVSAVFSIMCLDRASRPYSRPRVSAVFSAVRLDRPLGHASRRCSRPRVLVVLLGRASRPYSGPRVCVRPSLSCPQPSLLLSWLPYYLWEEELLPIVMCPPRYSYVVHLHLSVSLCLLLRDSDWCIRWVCPEQVGYRQWQRELTVCMYTGVSPSSPSIHTNRHHLTFIPSLYTHLAIRILLVVIPELGLNCPWELNPNAASHLWYVTLRERERERKRALLPLSILKNMAAFGFRLPMHWNATLYGGYWYCI